MTDCEEADATLFPTCAGDMAEYRNDLRERQAALSAASASMTAVLGQLQEVTERDAEREKERAEREAKAREEERERTRAAEKALEEVRAEEKMRAEEISAISEALDSTVAS